MEEWLLAAANPTAPVSTKRRRRPSTYSFGLADLPPEDAWPRLLGLCRSPLSAERMVLFDLAAIS